MDFKWTLHNAEDMERLLTWNPQMFNTFSCMNTIFKILEVFLIVYSIYFFGGGEMLTELNELLKWPEFSLKWLIWYSLSTLRASESTILNTNISSGILDTFMGNVDFRLLSPREGLFWLALALKRAWSSRRLATACHTNSLSGTWRRLAFLLPAKYFFLGKKKIFYIRFLFLTVC